MLLNNFKKCILSGYSLCTSGGSTGKTPLLPIVGNGVVKTVFNIQDCVLINGSPDTSRIINITQNDLITAQDVTIGNINTGRDLALAIGSGITEATLDDYRLDLIPSTNLTETSNRYLYDNNLNFIISKAFTNTGTENIIVNEVGIISYAGTSKYTILLTRTVLDAPVIINPGQTKTFTIKIDFNKFIDKVNEK